MKWNNPPKDWRREFWHIVGPCRKDKMREAHKWLQAQESDGQFYYHYTNIHWWFEKEEDAIMFVLKFHE